MDGTPENGSLLDVIATLTSRRESGRLQITVPGSRGSFFFKEGKLVTANMGPFSGFPAVNFAISLGEATLKFDPAIQPPPSTFISLNERELLRERFGIETFDSEEVEDGSIETDRDNPPAAMAARVSIPETTPSDEASALASRIDTEEQPGEITSPATTLERTTSDRGQNAGIKERLPTANPQERALHIIPEEEKRGQIAGSAWTLESSAIDQREDARTKRCPKCNRVYSDFRSYCRYDAAQLISESDTSFIAAVKPEGAVQPALFWTLITFTLIVGGILGYFLNRYLAREPNTPPSIRVASNQPPNADADQPVVEGPLHGTETTVMKPEYPARAKSEGISGKVTVAILVNKRGRVVSARALTGPPMLRSAAVVAARESKFSPEKLAGERSKIAGTITYNFKL